MDLKGKYIRYDPSIEEEQIEQVIQIAYEQGFKEYGSSPNYFGLKVHGYLRFDLDSTIQSVSSDDYNGEEISINDILDHAPSSSYKAILEECKRRFPIGSKVKSLTGRECTVTAYNHHCQGDTEIWFLGEAANPQVYAEGMYATLIEPNMQTILEKCKRKYPIGTRFKSAYNGNTRTVRHDLETQDDAVHDGSSYVYHQGRYGEVIKEEPIAVESSVSKSLESYREKAERLYPKGTKFIPVHTDKSKGVVTSLGVHYGNNGNQYVDISANNNAWVYYDGKWAQIIYEEPVPLNESAPKMDVNNDDYSFEHIPWVGESNGLQLLEDKVLEVKIKKKAKRNLSIKLIN